MCESFPTLVTRVEAWLGWWEVASRTLRITFKVTIPLLIKYLGTEETFPTWGETSSRTKKESSRFNSSTLWAVLLLERVCSRTYTLCARFTPLVCGLHCICLGLTWCTKILWCWSTSFHQVVSYKHTGQHRHNTVISATLAAEVLQESYRMSWWKIELLGRNRSTANLQMSVFGKHITAPNNLMTSSSLLSLLWY